MMILFQIVLLTFIWVMGIKISTSEGMIFEKLGEYGQRKVDEGHKIWEALIVCQWCLPSVHSIFGYAFAFGLGILPFEWDWELIIMWPLVVMGSSFLCGFTWNIYETINRVREKNEAEANYFLRLQGEEEINNN